MLPGTGLGDNPGLAQALSQQTLTHDIVYLVGPGVVEVIALYIDLRATQLAAEILKIGNRRRTTRIVLQQSHIVLPEFGVCFTFAKALQEFLNSRV